MSKTVENQKTPSIGSGKKSQQTAITPTRAENYPEWYQQVVKAADLAESSPVRGCMVIKPWGFAVWELMQRALDDMIKETGHVNACFPLLIPLSFLEKEASHVEGFAKECAVVTHHRLEGDGQGNLIPAGKLDEPYIIRPTSETIIGHSYSKWVQSYRDLPILINQWCNVMRWEMRTRIFLRTSEFLWQEGHTAHETKKEAEEETLQMLDVYKKFVVEWLALPVVKGIKTADERFPGADETYTIEAMMQDGKSLQAGTSHFLGQNFSKASDISFLDREGNQQYAWTTSWGATTRLIGAMVMTHSDDNGLVLPPKVAPKQIVIMPMIKKKEQEEDILAFCKKLKNDLQNIRFDQNPIRVEIDHRDLRGGEKAWQHIKKGTPIRLEVGPRDFAENSVFMGRRDLDPKDKKSVPVPEFLENIAGILQEIQKKLLDRATAFREENTHEISTVEQFKELFSKDENKQIQGGFAVAYWSEDAVNHPLLSEYKVTPRCIPLLEDNTLETYPEGSCLFTGVKTNRKVIFAKSY